MSHQSVVENICRVGRHQLKGIYVVTIGTARGSAQNGFAAYDIVD